MVTHSMTQCGRLCRAKWRAMQVELHGQYSSVQLERFEQYQSTTSLWRVAVVCLATPLPTVLVVVALGLLRLEPIEMGVLGSPHVWLRQWLAMVVMSLCTLQQVRHHLPEFEINAVDCAVISLCASTFGVGSVFALASVVGYPLPFTMNIAGNTWYMVFNLIFILRKRRIFREKPTSMPRMNQYLLMAVCQLAMTFIYPIYSYVYERISSIAQTACVLLLPLIKLLSKNWIYHKLPDSDDAKPEAVVFNVEVFHALFVSLCMGNTTTTRTVVVLMTVDLLEAWLSFHDILEILSELQPITRKLTLVPHDVQFHSYPQIAMLARAFSKESNTTQDISQNPQSPALAWGQTPVPNRLLDKAAKALHNARVTPQANLLTTDAQRGLAAKGSSTRAATAVGDAGTRIDLTARVRASLTSVESAMLVMQTEKLLFLTEFVVLVEYTEVIVPTVYNILVWVFYTLPNREFYTFLHGLCTRAALHTVISNVQLYAALEMLSLVAMAIVVWRKIGLSVLHQLAFVLEDRAANIQSKLLLWVVYISQNAIVQLGSDYSFQFQWLHQTPGAPPFVFGTPCANTTTL